MADKSRSAILAGEVVELAESEYLYGTGPVRLRVGRDVPFPTGGLIRLAGMQIGWNDSERPRQVYVDPAVIVRHAARHRRTPT